MVHEDLFDPRTLSLPDYLRYLVGVYKKPDTITPLKVETAPKADVLFRDIFGSRLVGLTSEQVRVMIGRPLGNLKGSLDEDPQTNAFNFIASEDPILANTQRLQIAIATRSAEGRLPALLKIRFKKPLPKDGLNINDRIAIKDPDGHSLPSVGIQLIYTPLKNPPIDEITSVGHTGLTLTEVDVLDPFQYKTRNELADPGNLSIGWNNVPFHRFAVRSLSPEKQTDFLKYLGTGKVTEHDVYYPDASPFHPSSSLLASSMEFRSSEQNGFDIKVADIGFNAPEFIASQSDHLDFLVAHAAEHRRA